MVLVLATFDRRHELTLRVQPALVRHERGLDGVVEVVAGQRPRRRVDFKLRRCVARTGKALS